MTAESRTALGCRCVLIIMIAVLAPVSVEATEAPAVHPLEPPDRSSPRATLTTFFDSIDLTWELYSADEPGIDETFTVARECLDLSEVPPLVFREFSGMTALILKEVLDRIELPPLDEIPDAAMIDELGISRWTIPHTEITLVRAPEGEGAGEWLFSKRTVSRAESYFERVRHLPYQPGRTGGHIEELRSGTRASLLMKFAQAMPQWFRSEIGGMLAWQWFGLGLLVTLLALGVLATAWISRRLGASHLPGHSLASFLLPIALTATPFAGRFMIARIFQLPGTPALMVRLAFSIVGSFGLAWLVAVLITRFGDLIVGSWFRNARPLKKQLVRVIFRIATIVVVIVIVLLALHRLGAPVAGLVAGLGVGGLAIALAAQSTLENFIGGIILYADQPVKVGDVCKFGSRRGTVEDVGLRSVRIRTIERTVVSIPNGDFAKMQLENLSDRDKVLLREELCLRYETTRDQLREVLAGLESMVREHPQLADEPMRVRFTGYGQHFLEVELFAYAMTSAWPEFLEIREDVLLKVMEIVEGAGTRLALPTEIHYVSGENAPDTSSVADPHAT